MEVSGKILQPFVPVNNTYKKKYASIPEEINYNNFGAKSPIQGGLGARYEPAGDATPSKIRYTETFLKGEPGPYNPEKHIEQPMYKDYNEYISKAYIPRKDLSKHIGLNSQDIQGASPTKLQEIRGLKRSDFFPNDKDINDYYNKETHGGNVSPKGYFKNTTMRNQKPEDHRYIRRHYP